MFIGWSILKLNWEGIFIGWSILKLNWEGMFIGWSSTVYGFFSIGNPRQKQIPVALRCQKGCSIFWMWSNYFFNQFLWIFSTEHDVLVPSNFFFYQVKHPNSNFERIQNSATLTIFNKEVLYITLYQSIYHLNQDRRHWEKVPIITS
jgi:hypothetical protein